MSPTWVNGRFLDESPNKKIEKWKPVPPKEKKLWGTCSCGELIYEGDSVGMVADHERVVCYSCWLGGALPNGHVDCAGLKFPDATFSP